VGRDQDLTAPASGCPADVVAFLTFDSWASCISRPKFHAEPMFIEPAGIMNLPAGLIIPIFAGNHMFYAGFMLIRAIVASRFVSLDLPPCPAVTGLGILLVFVALGDERRIGRPGPGPIDSAGQRTARNLEELEFAAGRLTERTLAPAGRTPLAMPAGVSASASSSQTARRGSPWRATRATCG